MADSSTMKTDSAVNVAGLMDHQLQQPITAKLDRTSIRSLCAGQYFMEQHLSTRGPRFCYFHSPQNYFDGNDYGANKRCSNTYSASRSGYSYRASSYWSQGFGQWGRAGDIITQLDYRDGRRGSHIQNGASSGDPHCGGNGGCHSWVFCRPTAN